MKTEFPCPVCSSEEWRDVQTFQYLRADHQSAELSRRERIAARLRELSDIFLANAPVPKTVHFTALNGYERMRRRVLFEVWFSGQEKLQLTTRICNACGFMAYADRPDDDDIREKYLFLNAAVEENPSPVAAVDPLVETLERRRAERVHQAVRKFMPQGKLDVLDYGGADGKMLRPFLERGDECALVDYDHRQIEGVKKIANDLSDMPEGVRYDVIICNHVLEHVAEPLQLVDSLRTFLKPSGVIFAEVPHQILAGVRLGADPVTHVNFFSPGSFDRLFAECGLERLEGGVRVGNYGRARLKVNWILARNQPQGEQTQSNRIGSRERRRLLHPGRLHLLGHILQIHLLPRLENLWLRWRN